MRLATRTFWWFVLPFAALLVGSFWAVQARVQAKVRSNLETSVKQAQESMANARAQQAEHNGRVLRVVSQNPALKAVVQLMLGDRADAQARRTVEEQLIDIGEDLGFSFLLVADSDGTPLAAVMRQEGKLQALDLSREHPPREGYFTSAGRTYQVTSIPIDQGNENLGGLSVGERFDLSAVPGQAVLLHNGEIIETNAPALPLKDLDASLRGCARGQGCEFQLRGETYVSQALEGSGWGSPADSNAGYEVRSLENVDAAAGDIQAGLRRTFVLAGLGALLLAILVSTLSTRSIVRPISDVMARLQESARTGELPFFDLERESVPELRELTASFNRAAEAVREGRQRLEQANVEFIESLASALDARDPYTAGHSRRVSQYACATAQAMGLPAEAIQQIRVGALLHDIGKIGISDAVLRKPGGLTPDEDALIRQHPVIGRRILEGVHGFHPYLDIVELHHENWDGSGYPRRLRREQTPLAARVVKIADAWDAMTSDRPYRQGMSRNQALAALQKASGSQMDPALTEVFCALWGAEALVSADPAESLARLAGAIGRQAEGKEHTSAAEKNPAIQEEGA